MATAARNHHWIPQCYLRGFARSPSKNAQLYVVDSVSGKAFMTTPRNVASERDFNRIEVDGMDPDHVEGGYARFEGVASAALRRLCDTRDFGSAEDHNLILNLIALLAIRNPRMRESSRRMHETLIKRAMDVATATKDRFERSMAGAVRSGYVEPDHGMSYESMRDFVERDRFIIELPTTRHVEDELKRVDVILPLLGRRCWMLLRAAPGTGGFVTSDHPVVLDWIDRRGRGTFQSPAHGLKSTEVIFPVSQDLVMYGQFEGRFGVLDVGLEAVTRINTDIIAHAQRQVYAKDDRFHYAITPGRVSFGADLLRDLSLLQERSP